MTDKTSVAPTCALELPAIPPLPGVCPRDAIRPPVNPGVVVVETFQALTVEAKDDDATAVVSFNGPKAGLRTDDCSDEGDGWTTDEDAENLRETAKYDAEIYHQLGDFICPNTDLSGAPPTGRDLFPVVVAEEPSETRRRPKKGCVVCWKITRKSCSRCRSARYCSKECQAEAWPLHKDHCNHYRYLKRYLIPEVVD